MARANYYETLYALRPDVSDEEREALRERLFSAIQSHSGEVVKAEKWAERELAYRIDNCTKAAYYIVIHKALPGVVADIEGILRGARGNVLRFITVKIDEETALKAQGVEPASDEKPKKKKKRNLVIKKRYGRYQFDALTPEDIDYKNIDLLKNFITERKKIVPRRTSGLSAYGQRLLSNAIKRARVMALLPFTVLHD